MPTVYITDERGKEYFAALPAEVVPRVGELLVFKSQPERKEMSRRVVDVVHEEGFGARSSELARIELRTKAVS